MKWSEMTPEERDRLVHEKVMGHSPDELCKGEFIANPHDGAETLYCPKCNACVFFGDSKKHKRPLLPGYTTDMNVAMKVANHGRFHGWMLDAFKPWTTINGVSHQGEVNEYTCHLYLSCATSNLVSVAKSTNAAESICLASLKACGIETEQQHKSTEQA